MSSDFTAKVFAGVERMVGAASKAVLVAVDLRLAELKAWTEQAIKAIPHGPAGPAGPQGMQGEKGIAGERGADGVAGKDGAPGPQGEKGLAGPQGERGPEGVPGRDGRDAIPMPGPQGERGEKGADGRDGKDGRDSDVTRAEMEALIKTAVKENTEHVIRSIAFDVETRELRAGDRVLAKFPYIENKGVYQQGVVYERGHLVTWGGSSWECVAEKATEAPTDSSKMWRLMVKAGRNGKDRT